MFVEYIEKVVLEKHNIYEFCNRKLRGKNRGDEKEEGR